MSPHLIERLYLLLIASFTTAVVTTPGLWCSRRPFPRVPVWFTTPYIDDRILISLSLLLLLLSYVRRLRRFFFVTGALFLVYLVLEDLTRLQPYVYLYLSLLTLINFPLGRAPPQLILAALSALYVWSGIHKINIHFVNEVFPWLVTEWAPERVARKIALFIPFLEIGAGVFLTSQETRRFASLVLLLMHLGLLLLLGPLGLNWNSSVWIWNITMPIVCLLLASQRSESLCTRTLTHPLVALLTLAPALNFFGLFDHYLSFSLYSGLTPRAWIIDEKRDERKSIQEWSLSTTGVPPYPEKRVYKALASEICKKEDVLLEVQEPRGRLRPGMERKIYSCRDVEPLG